MSIEEENIKQMKRKFQKLKSENEFMTKSKNDSIVSNHPWVNIEWSLKKKNETEENEISKIKVWK